MKEKPYECEYCGKTFVLESRYLKHHCEKMQRRDDIKTLIGQTAYTLYQLWFTTKKKTAPSVDTFMDSKYYKAFMNFAAFVKRLNIDEPELFIRMMNEKNILPVYWTSDEMYAYFLEYLDRTLSPRRQASRTIKTIEKVADNVGCNFEEVFEVMNANDIIQMIRERKLSPWIIMRSRKFMTRYELMSAEEQQTLSRLVRFDYWKQKFQSREADKKLMDKLVKEMEL